MEEQQSKPEKRYKNRAAFEEVIALEKMKALEAGFKPQPSNEWMDTKGWWANATEAEKRDMVYGLCANSAAKPRQIARYFCIKETDLKPYQEQIYMGEAARVLKIQSHQMRWALSTNQPHAKFFLGLQFASQVQNPLHEDVQSLDEKKEGNISITVIGKDGVSESTNGTDSVYEELSQTEHKWQ